MANLRTANGTRMLRILSAFFPFVSNQRLHPSVFLTTIWAEMSSESLVIVWTTVSWKNNAVSIIMFKDASYRRTSLAIFVNTLTVNAIIQNTWSSGENALLKLQVVWTGWRRSFCQSEFFLERLAYYRSHFVVCKFRYLCRSTTPKSR